MLQLSAFIVVAASAAYAQQGEPPRGPPQEAITACNGLSSGTACGFTINGKNLTGTCSAGHHDGESLSCRPEGFGGRHHGPPPAEATAACSGQANDATCSFTKDGKTMSGTCKTPPGASAAACLPEHKGGPGGGHHGPPPEAISACASSSAGASCTVSFNGKSLTGTCASGPNGDTLACRPARPD